MNKSILSTLLSSFFCIFITFSCSNDIKFDNIQKKQNSQLIADLERINQELLLKLPHTHKTKGWSNWNREEKIKVVISDIGGAYGGAKKGFFFGAKIGIAIGSPHLVGGGCSALGALIGGAFASWMAAPTRLASDDFEKIQETCRIIVNNDLTLNENAIILKSDNADKKISIAQNLLNETNLDKESLNIAKMHNIILSTLDGSITLDKTAIKDNQEAVMINYLLNSTEFIDSCKIAAIKAKNMEYGSDNDMTIKVMSLFNTILKDYASKTDDVAFIIGKYMEVIESTTELTNEQKNFIRYGLATAIYSSNYWDKQYNEVTQ